MNISMWSGYLLDLDPQEMIRTFAAHGWHHLELADEHGLDLVEVSPNADPPVCRLMDYGKYKYDQDTNQNG